MAWRRSGRRVVGGAAVAAVVGAALTAVPAWASTVSSASFSGGAGTASVGGVLYAKQGAALTLTVATSSDTKCVDVSGAATLPRQTSSTARSSWTFTTTAPAGNGAQAFTVAASPNFNANGCTGQTTSTQASYTLDNTGPVVGSDISPAPNAAGWNNSDVTVKWTATDAGVGVSGAQPFRTDSITANGITALTAPAQSDRLGNTGSAGAATVRIDKAKPTITASQTKNADGTTTVTFTCDDSSSGGGQGSGIATCLADGSTTNAKTVQPGVTVTGTATDKAGNTATATSTAPAGDTTAPLLSGTPTTQPNGNGWYRDDVTIHWTASDPESGIPTPPADTTISGEGAALTSSTTVKNGAGLTTTATSSPAVKIDRTAPVTAITGTVNTWVNGSVTLALAATDNLSQVDKTRYAVDGGASQEGTSVTLTTEGDHTITFSSTDKAGNAESVQTAHVKIDKTAPTISHAFTPLSYKDGSWTNQNVTVTFTCADQGGSGVASCTAPVSRTAEGTYDVTGTATDGAGNSATDVAHVLIDKTAPEVTATVAGTKSSYGWYGDDVTVTWTATDVLSGLAAAPAATVLGQGADQSASRTVTDVAGNSATAGVSGINVDKTAPVLSASYSSGWHTGDVAVSWTCTDALSGVATGPSDDTVTGEGSNLSSTASCTDKAGNTVTRTVSGVQIDRTAPTTTATLPDPLASGWYGAPVQVTLTGSDNGSGVDTTYYTVDGGTAQVYDGAFSFGTEGTHTITFWSKDVAGNVEKAGAPVTVRIDRTAPTTTVTNPVEPDSGWYVTSGIPVAFEAADAGSGIKATYYTIDGGPRQTYGEPFTADLSTGTHTITYWSVDLADNEEAHDTTNTIAVKVDTIAPTITAQRNPAPNAAGWNNTDVKVTFACSDADSGVDGIAGCGPDQTVSSEGSGQTVRGDTKDIAGNAGSVTVDKINIDKTAPSLTGAPTGDSNGGEWYRGDVSIAWTGTDGLSGIDPATQPANSTVKGEGRDLGASASISDKAGNKGTGSVSGVNIDRTPLNITAQLPAGKNDAGWYRGAVTVGFACADPNLADGSAGSGVGTCPSDAMVSGDGANQSVTSDTARDVAGNTSTRTVTGINIDGHEPQTTADNQCTATNGYCTGDKATVVLTASDVGPSGVREIRYSVNGGSEQVVPGASTSVSVPLSGTGAASVKYYAVDVAGNVEPANQVALKYDNIAPTVTHTVNPKANAADWNNSDVTVHFDAKDTDPGSGVVAGSVTPDQVVSTETTTAGVVVNGSAKDTAGNTGTDSVTVKLDKTKPTISGTATGTLGRNGWYTSPVKVHFTCSDALSGLGTCQDDVTLSNNGANQSANGSAKDLADNITTSTVSGINIDNENPTITKVNVANGFYTVGGVPAATCDATDSFSGLDTCKVAVTGGTTNGVGTFSWTATATDKAGNTASQSGTYKVVYRFDGFLQPINDTAHQVGTSTSVFKAGSTIPVKFQLKRADGTLVQAATAPAWLAPVKGGSMSLPVDETVQSVTADSGSTFRYDSTDQQYIFNWKSGTGGSYWQIGVKLDDGQTYYVNIGLR